MSNALRNALTNQEGLHQQDQTVLQEFMNTAQTICHDVPGQADQLKAMMRQMAEIDNDVTPPRPPCCHRSFPRRPPPAGLHSDRPPAPRSKRAGLRRWRSYPARWTAASRRRTLWRATMIW